jgi:REP element-mobilizing transposase RayT
VVGYVIMPNHIHVLISFTKSEKSINKIVGNGKRFLAYGIVERLKSADRQDILTQLQSAVHPKDRSRGKKHELFEASFDIKECRSLAFAIQKLDYIHANPVSKKWNLAADMASYPHSSARFYLTGVQGEYEVLGLNDLF